MRLLRVVFSLLIFLSLLYCTKEIENGEQVIFFQNKKATWIQDFKDLPQSDSLFYLEDPAPLFRKSFNLKSSFVIDKPVISTASLTQL